jgi:hypothetical protein
MISSTCYHRQASQNLRHLTNIICDKFGAQKKHKEIGSVLIFDIDKLAKIAKSYDLDTHIQLKLPDGSDSSDDFSNTMMASKENDDTKIINNSRSSVGISEGNTNNIVNNTQVKDVSNPVTLVKPSAPSDPSAGVAKEFSADIGQQAQQVSKSIFRLGHSDMWACKNCRQRGDKWFMQKHLCRSSR